MLGNNRKRERFIRSWIIFEQNSFHIGPIPVELHCQPSSASSSDSDQKGFRINDTSCDTQMMPNKKINVSRGMLFRIESYWKVISSLDGIDDIFSRASHCDDCQLGNARQCGTMAKEKLIQSKCSWHSIIQRSVAQFVVCLASRRLLGNRIELHKCLKSEYYFNIVIYASISWAFAECSSIWKADQFCSGNEIIIMFSAPPATEFGCATEARFVMELILLSSFYRIWIISNIFSTSKSPSKIETISRFSWH